ncbi:histidine kinase [Viridibacillus sp. YIM B01967]|uniref:Histidine kinase n=2 Tax=Viridibacillus soli TaxID=2798301 RepID=A0ABS1HB03_9BACL|nr:histidine kinase [Viridibacillus soli]
MKFALPLMAVVAVSAMMLLNKDYTDVPMNSRIMIAAGAALFSGTISFVLFGLKDAKDDTIK